MSTNAEQIKEPGVYQIRNKVNGKVYIGSALEIAVRWRGHRSQLRNNKHHCSHLQSAWNKYGANSFEFSVLEFCDREQVRERESFFIKSAQSYLPEIGYNTIVDPMYPSHSEESKEKNRQAHLGKKLTEDHKKKIAEGNRGKSVSKETREKIRTAFKGKKRSREVSEKIKQSLANRWGSCPTHSEDQIRFILTEYQRGTCRKEIAKKAGIPYSKIYSIKNGWVKHLVPIVVKIKQELGMQ